MAHLASANFVHQDNTQASHQERVICAQWAISKASRLGLTKTPPHAASAPAESTRAAKGRLYAFPAFLASFHLHLGSRIVLYACLGSSDWTQTRASVFLVIKIRTKKKQANLSVSHRSRVHLAPMIGAKATARCQGDVGRALPNITNPLLTS